MGLRPRRRLRATTAKSRKPFFSTQVYIDLSGAAFREEAERLEERLWGTDRALDTAREGA